MFVTELWTNYPAGTLKARVPVTTVATERGKRLAGESKMNFVSLVLHGLSSIAVYLEVVAVRMLIVSAVFITLSFVGIGFVLYWRLFTALAIPGWASNAIGVLIGILLQALLLSVFLVFLVLNSRTQQVSTPHIQYAHFIRRVESLFHRS